MPHLFARLGFDVDRFQVQAEQGTEPSANLILYRSELRLLGEDDHIYIDHAPTGLVQAPQRFVDEQAGIAIAVSGVCIGKSVADVAHSGSAEQSVGYRVQHHVGVAVTNETTRMV